VVVGAGVATTVSSSAPDDDIAEEFDDDAPKELMKGEGEGDGAVKVKPPFDDEGGTNANPPLLLDGVAKANPPVVGTGEVVAVVACASEELSIEVINDEDDDGAVNANGVEADDDEDNSVGSSIIGLCRAGILEVKHLVDDSSLMGAGPLSHQQHHHWGYHPEPQMLHLLLLLLMTAMKQLMVMMRMRKTRCLAVDGGQRRLEDFN
jgi:hypothetical protein